MNIAYCFWLKHIALVDVFVISIGFVLRVLAGGVVTGIWISPWIILMTFLLALFLSFAKRRDDVLIYERTGDKMRLNIARYNLEFINRGYRGRLLHYVYCITGGDRKNGDLQSLSDYDMGFGWNLTLFAVDSGR